jgi:hypothetical protein
MLDELCPKLQLILSVFWEADSQVGTFPYPCQIQRQSDRANLIAKQLSSAAPR